MDSNTTAIAGKKTDHKATTGHQNIQQQKTNRTP